MGNTRVRKNLGTDGCKQGLGVLLVLVGLETPLWHAQRTRCRCDCTRRMLYGVQTSTPRSRQVKAGQARSPWATMSATMSEMVFSHRVKGRPMARAAAQSNLMNGGMAPQAPSDACSVGITTFAA
jgi:hypothetical protein